MDLEVSSDEEAPPRKPVKKRKKVDKSKEEVDAADQQRDGALAAVSYLEDNMKCQTITQDGTPRVISTAKSISRTGSYVAPDPPAYSKAVFSSEDENEAIQPLSKKTKLSAHVDDFEPKAKQWGPKRNTKPQQTIDLDEDMVCNVSKSHFYFL
ncbi:hypothetical protein HWV62_11311 [Athelia sp. TMB]|nr:hypothetical protein HWV62_11311 [Athelia sp. TMB]